MLVDIQHTCSLRILSCTVEDMQFNYESSLSKPILAVSRLIFGVCPLDTTKQLSTTLIRICIQGFGFLCLNEKFASQHCQDGLSHNAEAGLTMFFFCLLRSSRLINDANSKGAVHAVALQRFYSLHQVFSVHMLRQRSLSAERPQYVHWHFRGRIHGQVRSAQMPCCSG